MSTNLGQVAAILYSTTAPTNTEVLWGVTTTLDPETWELTDLRYYHDGSWVSLANFLLKKSADFTAVLNATYAIDTVGGDVTVTLPAMGANEVGMVYVEMVKGTNNIILTPSSGQIDGAASLIINELQLPHRVVWDGTEWIVYVSEATVASSPDPIIKEITGSTYTLLPADNAKRLHFTNAAGCIITVPQSLPIEFDALVISKTAGTLQFTPASGVTLEAEALNVTVQNTAAQVFHDGSDTVTILGRLS
jgi:hypothetical protein